MPTDEEIEEVIQWCGEKSHFPGMTYEEGVRAAIDWMLGDGERPDE